MCDLPAYELRRPASPPFWEYSEIGMSSAFPSQPFHLLIRGQVLSDAQPPHPSLEFCIWKDLKDTSTNLLLLLLCFVFLDGLLSGQRTGPPFSK